MAIDQTDECNAREHGRCGGQVRLFDTPDGPNTYLCACYCHYKSREVTCSTCDGTGKVRSRRWTNDRAITTR